MTASRPAQVTQSEGETERDGEKGGWAGTEKDRGAGGGGGGRKEEEIKSDRKDRGGREREREGETEK